MGASKSIAGFVYYLRREDGGQIKIGYSLDPVRRAKTIERAIGCAVTILAVRPGRMADEAAEHRRFSHLALGCEWFRPDSSIGAYIASLPKMEAAASPDVDADPFTKQAREWAAELEDIQARRSDCSIVAARELVAEWLGCPPGTLENFRKGRGGAVSAVLFERIRSRLEQEYADIASEAGARRQALVQAALICEARR